MMNVGDENYLTEQYYDTPGEQHDLNNKVPTGVDMYDTYNQSDSSTAALLTEEARAQKMEELRQVEEEIQTLQQVLTARFRHRASIRQQLGISVITELRTDINRGVDNLRTSEAYQKTTAAVKLAKEKTSAALNEKWNFLKQTNAFRSFENKLESAYTTVRGKLVRSATTGEDSTSPTETQPVENGDKVRWSKTDNLVLPDAGASSATSDPKGTEKVEKTSGEPTVLPGPASGTIQLDQLTLDELSDDSADEETGEFVQVQNTTKPNRRQRRRQQKQSSFAD